MSLRLTDTHCHLDTDVYDVDRRQVLIRSRATGLERILVPGTDLLSSQAALQLSTQERELFFAAGVHPTSALLWDENSLPELRRMATAPKAVAIGEIGLDYYWKDTPPEAQRLVLEAQLSLAAELELPAIIHCRDAFPDVLAIVDAWVADLKRKQSGLVPRPGVFHAFSGSLADAEHLFSLGFCLGITGVVTFPKASGLQQIVQTVPLDCLLIETDSPYLTPQPHRGKRNEPAYVQLVAEEISHLRGMLMEEITAITARNANRVFHWEVNA